MFISKESLSSVNGLPHDNEISLEQQTKLFLKWKDDPKLFLQMCGVITTHLGNRLYEPSKYQSELMSSVTNSTPGLNIIPLGSRQCGTSTFISLMLLHNIIFSSHETTAYLSRNSQMTRHMAESVRRLYFNLPKWLIDCTDILFGRAEIENKTSHSKIIFTSATESSLRGYSVSNVYVEEVDTVMQERLYECCYPSLYSTGGKFFIFRNLEPKVVEIEDKPKVKVDNNTHTTLPLRDRLDTVNSRLVKIEMNRLIKHGT